MNSPTIEELIAEKPLSEHQAIAARGIKQEMESAEKLAEKIDRLTEELRRASDEYFKIIQGIKDNASWFEPEAA